MPVCSKCGRESADDARFCAGCGASLADEAPRREERKVVSVVFVDLVGSTAQAERLDPEDVRAKLADYHARVRAELERHGGTVEKFIGDAVVAVFGAPIVHEDDAERAVSAADVSLRMAVNTGEALVTLDARPTEGEGMVAGDVVNTAARLQSAAPVDGILVGQGTYRATAHAIEYREIEPVVAKGKSEPIPAWEAVVARSRFGLDLEQAPPAALVGREQEVDLLHDTLARARRDRSPQLLTLVGVPGIGKSRLVTELFRIVDADPDLITWRQGRCLPYGDGISYWALGEMTKAQAGVLERDSAEEATRKLEDAVRALLPQEAEATWVIGHLRPLLGLSGDVHAGAEGRGETFAAWRRFLEALAEHRPTVLVFEDLHWGDDGLLDFVDGLVDRASGVPLLVVCSARPELLTRRPGWGGGKANALTLSLSALSDEDTTRLIGELLAQAVLPAEMQQTLIRRAEGNPLFAEEYIRMLRDRGLLRREGDVWRLDPGEVDVPETVQGIIAARLDALTTEEKGLLQDAAVVGKVFWLGAVAATAGVSAWEAEELLHGLERREFLRRERRASVAGETEYAFRHVLVRDVAYGQIPRARRADVHARAAAWIETLGDERAEDRAEMLAHHLVAAVDLGRAAGVDVGSLVPRALVALRTAGDRARSFGAVGSAQRFYERALALDPSAADDPWLLLGLGHVRLITGTGGEEELTLAARALEEIDSGAAAEAEITHGEIFWQRGDRNVAFSYFERALEMVEPLSDSRQKAFAVGQIARFRGLAGYSRESLDIIAPAIEIAERLGDGALLGDLLNTRGIVRTMIGDRDEGIADLEHSLELARATRSHWTARAYLNLGSTLVDSSADLARADRLLREGFEQAERMEQSLSLRWIRGNLVTTTFHLGKWSECVSLAEIELANPETHYQQVECRHGRALIRLARGDAHGALEDTELACVLAQSIRDPQVLIPALAVRALCLAATGDDVGAVDVLAELRRFRAAGDIADTPGPWTVDVALTALDLDLPAELGDGDFPNATPWLNAALAIARGELGAAADILQRVGAVAFEAQVRLRLGRRLLADGHRAEAAAELSSAIGFFHGVDAVADIRAAEALLPATG